MIVRIKENSWQAAFAARRLRADKVAMVLGNVIHLHNTKRDEFLRDKRWLRHEIAHVHQWKKHGRVKFAIMYLYESFNKGYQHNRFEVEARLKENDINILNGINIL